MRRCGVRSTAAKNKQLVPKVGFKNLPDELVTHIFSFLDGHNLALLWLVCRAWRALAMEDWLWREACIRRWRSFETDEENLWQLLYRSLNRKTHPSPWRAMYRRIAHRRRWCCRLQKTGVFLCNLVVHQVTGPPVEEAGGIPAILKIERRFSLTHLETLIKPDNPLLYFEPEHESDAAGYKDFIQYLDSRYRAGLALDNQLRYFLIPPCPYTREQLGYNGMSLLGAVQEDDPPLPENQ